MSFLGKVWLLALTTSLILGCSDTPSAAQKKPPAEVVRTFGRAIKEVRSAEVGEKDGSLTLRYLEANGGSERIYTDGLSKDEIAVLKGGGKLTFRRFGDKGGQPDVDTPVPYTITEARKQVLLRHRDPAMLTDMIVCGFARKTREVVLRCRLGSGNEELQDWLISEPADLAILQAGGVVIFFADAGEFKEVPCQVVDDRAVQLLAK